MTQNRRTFLRHAVGVGGVAVLGGLGGCAGVDLDPSDGADADDGDGDDQGADPPDLGLRTGMEIGVGTTALGGQVGPSEVDPDEPGGGRLVTVEAVEPGEQVTIAWRQTVEREIPPDGTPTVGVGEATPTPDVEVVEETGTITATGLADAHEPFLPMYWEPGETRTDTSAMWLSRDAFRELTETRRTAWSRDVLTRISRLSEEAVERIRSGTAEVDEVYLHAEPDFVEFELAVNNQTTAVSVIEAYDTFGNAYSIIDNEQNPLVVEFTYDAVSTGFAGIDAGLWALIKTTFSGYRVVSVDVP